MVDSFDHHFMCLEHKLKEAYIEISNIDAAIIQSNTFDKIKNPNPPGTRQRE